MEKEKERKRRREMDTTIKPDKNLPKKSYIKSTTVDTIGIGQI